MPDSTLTPPMPDSTLTLYGTLTATETETRILRYMLLPYGEYGRTSAGLVKAEAGALELPDLDALQFNLQHDRWKPIGRFTELAETEAGLTCAVRVSQTTAGNDLLVEAADGLRTGISVEIAEAVIDDQGNLTAGQLIGAGAVVDPAFPSAQLAAALNYTPNPEGEPTVPDSKPKTAPTIDALDAPMTPDFMAQVLASLATTGAAPAAVQPPAEVKEPTPSFPALLAAAVATGDTGKLQAISAQASGPSAILSAALADVPVQKDDHQAQWIGELWKARATYGRMWKRFQTPELTDMWVQGFDNPVTNELQIADYAGSPAELPTITVPTITAFNEQVKRAAVAFNYDRANVDFGKQQFIESFIQSGFNYWDRYLDLKAAAMLIASATTLVAKTPRPDVDPAITEVISGMQRLIRLGGTPGSVYLGESKAYAIATEKDRDKLANISVSMGLAEGTIESTAVIDASGLIGDNDVYVVDDRAASVYTLGSGPLRINALSLASGQISEALHGYYYTRVHDARAMLKVTPYVAG